MTDFFIYSKPLITHELGHWFVAKKLNFEVGDIKLKIIGGFGEYGHNGSSKIYPKIFISNIRELDTYLENRICILFAGVVAQAFFSENDSWTSEDTQNLLDTWGADDQSKIKELSFIFRVCKVKAFIFFLLIKVPFFDPQSIIYIQFCTTTIAE